jgi:hypothetical protein
LPLLLLLLPVLLPFAAAVAACSADKAWYDRALMTLVMPSGSVLISRPPADLVVFSRH